MSARPPAVRIDDLAVPHYSEEVRAILDFMEEAGSQLVLEPSVLMAAARAETGLQDFGPGDFVERLEVLCEAMLREGGFNGAGIMQQQVFILGLLKNRLLIEDLVQRHPEKQQHIEGEGKDPRPGPPEGPAARARRGTQRRGLLYDCDDAQFCATVASAAVTWASDGYWAGCATGGSAFRNVLLTVPFLIIACSSTGRESPLSQRF